MALLDSNEAPLERLAFYLQSRLEGDAPISLPDSLVQVLSPARSPMNDAGLGRLLDLFNGDKRVKILLLDSSAFSVIIQTCLSVQPSIHQEKMIFRFMSALERLLEPPSPYHVHRYESTTRKFQRLSSAGYFSDVTSRLGKFLLHTFMEDGRLIRGRIITAQIIVRLLRLDRTASCNILQFQLNDWRPIISMFVSPEIPVLGIFAADIVRQMLADGISHTFFFPQNGDASQDMRFPVSAITDSKWIRDIAVYLKMRDNYTDLDEKARLFHLRSVESVLQEAANADFPMAFTEFDLAIVLPGDSANAGKLQALFIPRDSIGPLRRNPSDDSLAINLDLFRDNGQAYFESEGVRLFSHFVRIVFNSVHDMNMFCHVLQAESGSGSHKYQHTPQLEQKPPSPRVASMSADLVMKAASDRVPPSPDSGLGGLPAPRKSMQAIVDFSITTSPNSKANSRAGSVEPVSGRRRDNNELVRTARLALKDPARSPGTSLSRTTMASVTSPSYQYFQPHHQNGHGMESDDHTNAHTNDGALRAPIRRIASKSRAVVGSTLGKSQTKTSKAARERLDNKTHGEERANKRKATDWEEALRLNDDEAIISKRPRRVAKTKPAPGLPASKVSKSSIDQRHFSSKSTKAPLVAKSANQNKSMTGKVSSRKALSSRQSLASAQNKTPTSKDKTKSAEDEDEAKESVQQREKRSVISSRSRLSHTPSSAKALENGQLSPKKPSLPPTHQVEQKLQAPRQRVDSPQAPLPSKDRTFQVEMHKISTTADTESTEQASIDVLDIENFNFDEFVCPSEIAPDLDDRIEKHGSHQTEQEQVWDSLGLPAKPKNDLEEQATQSFGSKLNQALLQRSSLIAGQALALPPLNNGISNIPAASSRKRDNVTLTAGARKSKSHRQSHKQGDLKTSKPDPKSSRTDISPSATLPRNDADKVALTTANTEAGTGRPVDPPTVDPMTIKDISLATKGPVSVEVGSLPNSDGDLMLEDEAEFAANNIPTENLLSKKDSSPHDAKFGEDEAAAIEPGAEVSNRPPLITYTDQEHTEMAVLPVAQPAAPVPRPSTPEMPLSLVIGNLSPVKSKLDRRASENPTLDESIPMTKQANIPENSSLMDLTSALHEIAPSMSPGGLYKEGKFIDGGDKHFTSKVDVLARESQDEGDASQKDGIALQMSKISAEVLGKPDGSHPASSPESFKKPTEVLKDTLPASQADFVTKSRHKNEIQRKFPSEDSRVTSPPPTHPTEYRGLSDQHANQGPTVSGQQESKQDVTPSEFVGSTGNTPFASREIDIVKASVPKAPHAGVQPSYSEREDADRTHETTATSLLPPNEKTLGRSEFTSKKFQDDNAPVFGAQLRDELINGPAGKNAIAVKIIDDRAQERLPHKVRPTPLSENIQNSPLQPRRRPLHSSPTATTTGNSSKARVACSEDVEEPSAATPATPAQDPAVPHPPPSPAPHKTPFRKVIHLDTLAEASSLSPSRTLSTPSRPARVSSELIKNKPKTFSERLRAAIVSPARPQFITKSPLSRPVRVIGAEYKGGPKNSYNPSWSRDRKSLTQARKASLNDLSPTIAVNKSTNSAHRVHKDGRSESSKRIGPLRTKVRFMEPPQINRPVSRRGTLIKTVKAASLEKGRGTPLGDLRQGKTMSQTTTKVGSCAGADFGGQDEAAELRESAISAFQERPKTAKIDKRPSKDRGSFFRGAIENEANQRSSKQGITDLRTPSQDISNAGFDTTLVDDESVFEDNDTGYAIPRGYAEEMEPSIDNLSSSPVSSSSEDEKTKRVRNSKKVWNKARQDPRRPYLDMLFDAVDELCFRLSQAEDGVKLKVKELERGGQWVLDTLSAAVSRYAESEEYGLEPRRRELFDAYQAVVEKIEQEEERLGKLKGLEELQDGMMRRNSELLERLAELEQDEKRES